MAIPVNTIISRALAAPCRRLLSSDGVTSPYLSITSWPGLFPALSIDLRDARKSTPEIGDAASAAKNLDEYQFMVCSLAPTLPDSSPSKLELQKYRLAVFAAFARLARILNGDRSELAEWSRHAKWLVEEISEAYLQAKSNVQTHRLRRKEPFDYFEVPEPVVETALRSYYGLQ